MEEEGREVGAKEGGRGREEGGVKGDEEERGREGEGGEGGGGGDRGKRKGRW